jgi:hypothetical protein
LIQGPSQEVIVEFHKSLCWGTNNKLLDHKIRDSFSTQIRVLQGYWDQYGTFFHDNCAWLASATLYIGWFARLVIYLLFRVF